MNDLLKGVIVSVVMMAYAGGGMWLISLIAEWEPRSLGEGLWLAFLGGVLAWGGFKLFLWLAEKIEPNHL